MKKQVTNVGGETLGIRFTLPERAIYGIEEGDVLDLGDLIVIKKEKKNGN